MSELPTGWKKQTLSETCQILAGFGFPERLQGKVTGDFPFYKVGDISETWKRGEVFLTKANHYISAQEASEIRAKPLPPNTTVFAKIGAAIALNRRAILSVTSLVDNNVMGLCPATKALDHKYLFYFICTVKLDELSRATTVPSVRKSDIEQIAIPIPPIPEQRRIVAEIEKQFSRLEEGVGALRRVQANLKRYRAAVLKAACEGQLVPTEAELAKSKKRKFETGEELLARILAERRKNWQGRGKYKEPAAPDMSKLPPSPEGWVWATVQQVSTKVVDGTHHTPNYVDSGIAFISVKDIRGGLIYFDSCRFITPDAHDELIKRCHPENGDILITKSGTIGRLAVVTTDRPFSLFVSVALIKPVRGIFDPKFLKVALEAYIGGINISQDIKGALLKNLHLEDLCIVSVCLLFLAEQARIVAEVERRLSVVEEMEATVEANLQRATRLRQSILQKAFAGKLA